MKRLEGRTAVVTGAASGIGRAVALKLAASGCHLALCDRNADGLAETAVRVEALGRRASRHVIDVANKAQMQSLVDEVVSFHGGVNIVVNNAGVTVVTPFEDHSLEDFEWLMGINFWGVVYGCKFFLPVLRSADEAHIVNISSVFGLLGVPLQTSYCASKFAVRGFSESLRAELLDSNIGVTSVHPAGVATNIVRDGRYAGKAGAMRDRLVADFATKMLPPEEAAELVVDAIVKNRQRVLIARGSRIIDTIQRLSPELGTFLAARVHARIKSGSV